MKWVLQITLTVLMLLVGSLSWSEDLSETGQKQIYKALDRNLSHLSENGKKGNAARPKGMACFC